MLAYSFHDTETGEDKWFRLTENSLSLILNLVTGLPSYRIYARQLLCRAFNFCFLKVLDELKKSTRWSELHVADNCCFHYRRVSRLPMFTVGTTSFLEAEFIWLDDFHIICNIFLEPVQYVCRPELLNAHHDLDFMLFWTSICWHFPMDSTHPVCQPVWLIICVFTDLLVASSKSLLLALLESRLGNGEDPLSWESETNLLWKVWCVRSKANYLFATVISNHFRHHIRPFHYECDTKQKTKDPCIIVFYSIGFL